MKVEMNKKIRKRAQIGRRNFRKFNLRLKNIYNTKNKNFNDSIVIGKSKAWKVKKLLISKLVEKDEFFSELKIIFWHLVEYLLI